MIITRSSYHPVVYPALSFDVWLHWNRSDIIKPSVCRRYRVQEFCNIVSEYLVFIDAVYYCAHLILVLILQERQLLS